MTHWILIADASGARVYSTAAPNQPLQLVHELSNPQARLPTHALVTDAPGRVAKAGAHGARSATAPQTSAHDEAAEVFARRVAEFLKSELDRGAYTSLALAAAPHFLGMLRSMLDPGVATRLRSTLARELMHIPAADLRQYASSLIPPGVFL